MYIWWNQQNFALFFLNSSPFFYFLIVHILHTYIYSRSPPHLSCNPTTTTPTPPPHPSCNPTTIPVPSPGMVAGRTDPTLAVCGEPGAGSSLCKFLPVLSMINQRCVTARMHFHTTCKKHQSSPIIQLCVRVFFLGARFHIKIK